MCGTASGDYWETRPARRVLLHHRPRPGDVRNVCTLCDECEEGLRGLGRSRKSLILDSEGLQNTAPPKPDRIRLLSHVRRATIDDQEALLALLSKKFGPRPKKLS